MSVKITSNIKSFFQNNYPQFLKNLLSICFKIRSSFEVKSFKQLDELNSQFSIEIGSTVKDIFTNSNKRIVENFLMKVDHEMGIESILKVNQCFVEESSALIYSMNYEKDEKMQVRFMKNLKNEEETFLELWYDCALMNSIKFDEYGITRLYCQDVFGKPKFSPDGKKIIFIAEHDYSKKFKNYFKSENETDDKFKEKESFEFNLSKFEYKQDFGETLKDKSKPSIFVFDIELGKFYNLNLDHYKDLYPSHAMFDYDSKDLIFSGFNLPFFKFGIVYCLKRESSIYLARSPILDEVKKNNSSDKKEKNQTTLIEISNNFHHKEYTNIFPIFSPDFNYLIWYSNEIATPHMNGLRINRIDWRRKKNLDKIESSPDEDYNKELNSIILFNKMNHENSYFNGIYSYEDFIAKTNFINDDIIIFNSIHKNTNQAYLYDIPENRMLKIPSDCHSQQIIYSNNKCNFLITLKSDVDKIPHLDVLHFNYEEYKKAEGLEIEKLENGATFLKNFNSKIFSSSCLTKRNSQFFKDLKPFSNNITEYVENIMESITVDDIDLNGIKGHVIYLNSPHIVSQIRDANWKMPLIYLIHGGPNSSIDRTFILSQLVFLAHGYMILVVNYPGSTGYGQNYLSSLSGNIGKLDVEACGNYLTNFIKLDKYKSLVDTNNLMLYGGSHGGYLSCWLVVHEKFRKMFSSAVVRNPVTDLCSSLATSDIPDWVLEQSTNERIESHYPPDQTLYNRMYDASPVFLAGNCVTPVLFCVGKIDKRVNCSNSLFYYHCLLKAKCETKLLYYPDDGHGLTTNETEVDSLLNIIDWFEKHLRK